MPGNWYYLVDVPFFCVRGVAERLPFSFRFMPYTPYLAGSAILVGFFMSSVSRWLGLRSCYFWNIKDEKTPVTTDGFIHKKTDQGNKHIIFDGWVPYIMLYVLYVLHVL